MATAVAFASCNDYLDKLPDDRAELKSVKTIEKALVYAYPDKTISYLTEFSSDNVTDNGKSYNKTTEEEEAYRFKTITQSINDAPKNVWSEHYKVVVTTNEVLKAIDELGLPEETNPLKAEALLCRAYAIFSLTNCFCMAYNDSTADKYYGIPYPKVVGEELPTRGTLAETYANINADIEEALPLLDDSYLQVPKYHFNQKAAYAFAARFNLYYQKWAKAKEYAEKALGANPLNVMHTSLSTYGNMTYDEAAYAFIDSNDPYNFLIVGKYSIMGRMKNSTKYRRFGHNRTLCVNETYWARMPWNTAATSSNNCLYEAKMLYGSNQSIFTPNVDEFFEVTDKINQTGFPHIMDVPFTADETNLVHAEACIALGQLDSALVDLNYFVQTHCAAKDGNATRPTLTLENLKTFWNSQMEFKIEDGVVTTRSTKKPFSAPFKLTDAENQTPLIYTLLHMRRIETFWKGMRFQDIKRYGIEFVHELDGEPSIVFKRGDLRGALQLPQDVIDAGLEANPR